MAGSVYDVIDSLNIGRDWKTTFKKIHITYYANYSIIRNLSPIFWKRSPELSELSFMNSLKLYTWFNPLGLVFGPFYYIYKGLYKKGIPLIILFLLLFYINDVTRVMSAIVFLYCACMINVDYFCKMVLNHPEVLSNPVIIGNDFNERVLAKLLTEKTSPLPYIFILLLLISPVIYGITKTKSDSESLKYLVSEPEKICDNKRECSKVIEEYIQKIGKTKNNNEISTQYYNVARAYYSIDDTINAIKSLDSSISFNKKNINAYLLRAKLCARMNNNIQSLLDYKEALKINPQATFLNYYIGFNYYTLGKYDVALEYFEKATRVHDEPLYFEAQAYTRHMLKDDQGAIRDIKKAITLYNKVQNLDKVKKLGNYLKTLEKQS